MGSWIVESAKDCNRCVNSISEASLIVFESFSLGLPQRYLISHIYIYIYIELEVPLFTSYDTSHSTGHANMLNVICLMNGYLLYNVAMQQH